MMHLGGVSRMMDVYGAVVGRYVLLLWQDI